MAVDADRFAVGKDRRVRGERGTGLSVRHFVRRALTARLLAV